MDILIKRAPRSRLRLIGFPPGYFLDAEGCQDRDRYELVVTCRSEDMDHGWLYSLMVNNEVMTLVTPIHEVRGIIERWISLSTRYLTSHACGW